MAESLVIKEPSQHHHCYNDIVMIHCCVRGQLYSSPHTHTLEHPPPHTHPCSNLSAFYNPKPKAVSPPNLLHLDCTGGRSDCIASCQHQSRAPDLASVINLLSAIRSTQFGLCMQYCFAECTSFAQMTTANGYRDHFCVARTRRTSIAASTCHHQCHPAHRE